MQVEKEKKKPEAEAEAITTTISTEDIEKAKRAKQNRLKKLINIKKGDNVTFPENNSAINRAIQECISDIWSSVVSIKCPHCGGNSPSIKMDGYTKFFVEMKGDKDKVSSALNKEKGFKEESADEEEGEEQKDGEVSKNKETKQTYYNPADIQQHLKMVWTENRELLKLMYGNVIVNKHTLARSKKGYKVISNSLDSFFIEALPVPPNRFRPENKLSDQTYLHDHTIMLSKVLNVNQELKQLIVSQNNKNVKGEIAIQEIDSKELKNDESTKAVFSLTNTIKLWIQLQDAVNTFMDSSKATKTGDREQSGVRQLLERKEGLFRMKMMGKRVNYAARSVISPDPYIDTNEVGVPLYVAKTLTFPENVNDRNVHQLRQYVINGAKNYPGANFIEENGVRIALETRTDTQRLALAKTLLNNSHNKIVHRHLISGDVMLFNRQPTLHKSSMMAHIARVLPKANTIRNHYANCSTYNADFDGDEMNLHLMQNHLARAEGYNIAITNNQYTTPKNGAPLRGLIQDSVVSSTFLTYKDTFLDREQYQQLLFSAIGNFLTPERGKLVTVPPAIMKPKPMWTGKQVITSLIKSIVNIFKEDDFENTVGLNMRSTTKVPFDKVFKPTVKKEEKKEEKKSGKKEAKKDEKKEEKKDGDSNKYSDEEKKRFEDPVCAEGIVNIRDNELLQGVIDKNQIGATLFGLVHSFYELYGGKLTEVLITSLCRLFLVYLQYHGFTCGVDDLMMEAEFNEKRKAMIDDAHHEGLAAAALFAGVDNTKIPQTLNMCNRPTYELNGNLEYRSKVLKRQPEVDYISVNNEISQALRRKLILEKDGLKDYDNAVKGKINSKTSEINSLTIPDGLSKKFPQNLFSAIILSGAKGSAVNHNQVSAMLGQQELEGRRVPMMPSGKTLPCYIPYDPNPRSWGYITDRFLTGVRPQDFYFHCMAGREGLIDTAVKTSVSGYLQRCLVKNMESLIVQYDYTVRDADGSVIQFYYGEDALDPHKTQFMKKYDFLEQNYHNYLQRYESAGAQEYLDRTKVKEFLKQREEVLKERDEILKQNQEICKERKRILSENKDAWKKKKEIYRQRQISDQIAEKIKAVPQIDTVLKRFTPGNHIGAVSEDILSSLNKYITEAKEKGTKSLALKKKFKELVYMKYFYTLIHPGDSVGCLAAQSIGEPSTQMTLNTFHLAGHGGANVTLGIPRLREILFKGPRKVKNPWMMLDIEEKKDIHGKPIPVPKAEAEKLARDCERLKMLELVHRIEVREMKKLVKKGSILPEENRYRLYNIFIELEDVKAIQESFNNVTLETLKDKFKNAFLLKLLARLSRELRKSDKKSADMIMQALKEVEEGAQQKAEDENYENEKDEEEEREEKTKEKKKSKKKTASNEKIETNPDEEAEANSDVEPNDETLKRHSQFFKKIKYIKDKATWKISLKVPLEAEKILMVNLVENTLADVCVSEIPGINRCHVVSGNNKFQIQTEGVNFPKIFEQDWVKKSTIVCNDICEIYEVYGVEAARNAIIGEINRVFKPYGINVDFRHMSLIADFMTFNGRLRPLTREGIAESISPFLKMSYEMASRFLSHSASHMEYEAMKTPSAQIVLGRAPKVGTGMFDVMHQLNLKKKV